MCLYHDHLWSAYHRLESAKMGESMRVNDQNLELFDLSKIHLANLKIYYAAPSIFTDFILEQYSYRGRIRACPGDCVIDGGACYGDTALYFANLVGEAGRVFAFEFVPENIAMFEKNVALNPHFQNITLVRRPLFENSHTRVSFSGCGGSARVDRLENAGDCCGEGIRGGGGDSHGKNSRGGDSHGGADSSGVDSAQKDSNSDSAAITIAIDDFVKENAIARVDFLKLDIEGSELFALKGAVETIKRDRPKLAICVYHSPADYTDIPIFLHDLSQRFGLGYEFYFDHFTLTPCESVFFGVAR